MKKMYFAAIVFFCLISSGTAQQTTTETMDPKAAGYYNTAIQFMKAEQYEDALKSVDSSLMIAKDYRIYFLQGQANAKLGKLNEALTSYNEAVKLKPDYEQGWMAAGNTSLAVKDYDNALTDFQKVASLTQDPQIKTSAEESINFVLTTQSIEFYNKGNELNKAGKFDEAIASYDKALEIQKDAKYYFQKGVVYSKMNKNAEAEKELRSAIALNDSFDVAYVALGGLLTLNKDYEGAVKNYEKALTVTQSDNLRNVIKESIAKTWFAAGNNYYKDKKYDQSIDAFLKSNTVSVNDGAFLGLAKSYIEKKKYNDANKALDSAKANQKTVTDGGIAYYRGVIHLNKGEDQKALDQFTASLTDPTYKKAGQAQVDYLKAKIKAGKK